MHTGLETREFNSTVPAPACEQYSKRAREARAIKSAQNLVRRTPRMKLMFDVTFMMVAYLVVFVVSEESLGFIGLLGIALFLSFVIVFHLSGYSRKRWLDWRRMLPRAVMAATAAYCFLIVLGESASVCALIGLITFFALVISRYALSVSGLLDTPLENVVVISGSNINGYIRNALDDALKNDAAVSFMQTLPDQNDLKLEYVVADAASALKIPTAQRLADFFAATTGRSLFVAEQPGFVTQMPAQVASPDRVYKFLKRFIDILFSSVALVLLSPLILLIILAIFLESRRNVFFIQQREGLHGTTFNLLKFRSMKRGASYYYNADIWTAKNDSRVTRVGKIIRGLRLDELPQLLNILKGDMSLVGPRPQRKVLNEMVPKIYATEKTLRLTVKPGLTGWAQVHGGYFGDSHDYDEKRNFEIEKLRYDLYYLRHRSLLMDLSILFRTLKVVAVWDGH